MVARSTITITGKRIARITKQLSSTSTIWADPFISSSQYWIKDTSAPIGYIDIDSNGNFIGLSGSLTSSSNTLSSVSPTGTFISASYPSGGGNGTGLVLDSSDNRFISNYNNPQYKGSITKTNSSNAIQWTRTWGGGTSSNYSYTAALARDSAGAIYTSLINPTTSAIIKLTDGGTTSSVSWAKQYSGGGQPWSIVTDSTNNVYLLDTTSLTKFNSSGTALNQARVIPFSFLAIDSSNNLYWWSTGQGGISYLVKLDSSLNIVWQRKSSISSTGWNYQSSITTDTSGNIYTAMILSEPTNFPTTGSRLVITKFNSSGTVLWSNRLYRLGSSYGPNNAGIKWKNGKLYISSGPIGSIPDDGTRTGFSFSPWIYETENSNTFTTSTLDTAYYSSIGVVTSFTNFTASSTTTNLTISTASSSFGSTYFLVNNVNITSAQLSSSSTVNASITYSTRGYANLSSATSISAAVGKLVSISKALSSTSTLTEITSRIRTTSVNLTDQFSTTFTCRATKNDEVHLSSSTALTEITNRTRATSSALSSTSQLTSVPNRTKKFTAALSSTTSINFSISNVIHATAGLQSSTSITAVNRRTRATNANITALSFVVTIDYRIRPEDASLSSRFSISATAVKIARTTKQLSSTSTLTSRVNDTNNAVANLTSTSSLVANARIVKPATANLTSRFTAFISAQKPSTGSARLISTCTLTVIKVGKVAQAEAHLSALFFELTAATKVHIDPALTYLVPADNFVWTVSADALAWKISPDTRQYTILDDIEYWTISADNRIYTL